MAVNLPTIQVTDAQAQRITAAFGTTEEYRKWLRRQVAERVIRYENSARTQALQAELDANASQVLIDLGVAAAPAPPPPAPVLVSPETTPPPA